MKPVEVPGIEVKPILDQNRNVLVFDLYVGGKWVGSRRTTTQCEQWLSYYTGVVIEATPGRAW